MREPSAEPGMDDRDFRVVRIAAPLRHSVTESIRNAIAAGRFKAGERLPERELCEMTGVSRTLVREALRQLESEGLIKVLPHRGPIVAGLTPKEAEGIYQVRRELEGLASQLFAEVARDAERAALRESFRQLRNAFQNEDPVVRLDAKNRFYASLVGGCGNEAIGQTLRMLNSRVMVLRATSLQAPGRARQSLKELNGLMDALMAGNGKAARKAAMEHVDRAAQAALNILEAQAGPAAPEAPEQRRRKS
ncbi:MAG: GntR family transcriptional regulator [Bradyrhizobiaceae bacterium]|nr:MAG: GntR family transcriptional regulator [Bradyrhizobiaceae bacterium]